MPPLAPLAEARVVAALLAASGRPDARRQLLIALDAPIAERAKLEILRYEIGLVLDTGLPIAVSARLVLYSRRLDTALVAAPPAP